MTSVSTACKGFFIRVTEKTDYTSEIYLLDVHTKESVTFDYFAGNKYKVLHDFEHKYDMRKIFNERFKNK